LSIVLMGDVMEFGVAWADGALAFASWMIGLAWSAGVGVWLWLAELQARYPQILNPQNVFGLLGFVFAIWKWWESREARLFRRFESMIERQEAQLVKARSDLLDAINRPGPGLLIRPPIFAEKAVQRVLSRRRWNTAFSMLPGTPALDRSLGNAISTCVRKASAHLKRLAFFREQVASARIIQGALAAQRAARASEEHESQRLDQEALDHFRAVLALPGHKGDLAALELIAHQLRRQELQKHQRRGLQAQAVIDAYDSIIAALEGQPESPTRNLFLARAKRWLAIVRYPASPKKAQELLDHAIELLTDFGTQQDRDLLELAETFHLDGVARLRLGQGKRGPEQLRLAEAHYRDLLRSLRARRRRLFRWMWRQKRFSGHRVPELRSRAEEGLSQVVQLLELSDKRQKLLMTSLARGSGMPRHSRKPPRLRRGRWLGF
jgi:hypothetical protein